MLGGVRLKVCYSHEKTCFAYISPKYSTNNEQTQCVQVLYQEKQVLLWVVFSSNVPEGQLACNPIFGRHVGLEARAEVFVAPYGDVKVLDELYVDADSLDDQEILEHNAELLQLRILDQLRLVVANQKAVVWISVSLPIVFTPKKTGILVNNSRIIIKVDAFNTYHKTSQITKSAARVEPKEIKFNNIGLVNEGMLRPYLNPPKRLVLRGVPIDSDGKKNLIHPYTVFIHEDIIGVGYKSYSEILATMQSIPSVITDNNEDETKEELNDLCVQIIPIDNVIFRSLCREVYNKNIPTVLIPKSLNAIVNVENGMKIVLTILDRNVDQPEHIDIVTYSENTQSETELIDKFKTCVIENTHSGKKFLINSNIVKQNFEICNGFLQFKLKPEKLKYTMLNTESFRHCTISAKSLSDTDLVAPKPIVSTLDYDYKNYCRTIKASEALIEKVMSHLYFEIHREANFKGTSEIKSNVLITGSSGTGKSTICQIIQKELTVWSHILHCRSLKGRKDIPEVLGKAVLMCQEHSPAVLICDDVDSLVPPNMEGGSPQDIAYYQRLAVVIKSSLQSCAGVTVLMTSLSMKSLHPTLSQFTGKPLFTAQFDIPELNQEERTELFKHLVNEKIRSEFAVEDDDVIRMAMDTAGQNVRDLTDYLTKRIFKAVKKKTTDPEDSKPRLIQDIHTDKDKSNAVDVWAPIGGMHTVKQELTECIFWPLMYPALFPSQSCGILLYGPPGTGKSFIGSCVGAVKGLNFIAVKGPELLSKYIGQSERAVRDVFDKADMKRPCVLFFDEFDSLAPRRGHDSTGVTDRVVNQLLARLDGAEGGAKCAVVAATSRPDLVDSALLRAGRLQRHIYCNMPDETDRYEILQVLSKDVTISPSVDLSEVAARTDGFSAADLKSLLVTAQLSSLEEQLDNASEDMKTVVVSQEDMEKALEETKPSLSREQLVFYDMVYKRFRGESLTKEEKVVSLQFNKQRVTLA